MRLYQPEPGQRLIFRNCKLLKRTAFQTTFREETRTIYRHVFNGENGLIIYTGKWLEGITIGKACDIRGTVKRIENFGGGSVRINRPIILKEKETIFLDGKPRLL